MFAYETIRFSQDEAHFSFRAAEFIAIRSDFFNIKIYSGKINNYMKILCRNDILSLKVKPISHMILIYVSLNGLTGSLFPSWATLFYELPIGKHRDTDKIPILNPYNFFLESFKNI